MPRDNGGGPAGDAPAADTTGGTGTKGGGGDLIENRLVHTLAQRAPGWSRAAAHSAWIRRIYAAPSDSAWLQNASGGAGHRRRAAWAWLRRRAFLLALLLPAFAAACTTADLASISRQPPISTAPRYAAIAIDARNGHVLYAEHADERRYPASLTKMMTLYLLFEAMESGRITPASRIPVSAHAASQPPSRLRLQAGDTISVETAIKALVTKSANDVAVAVAEYLGGTEPAFAAAMTRKARQLGLWSTVFSNASGLPDERQVTTARDMALLALALRAHFPGKYHYFSLREFTFRGRTIRGHNHLLGKVAGVDGIKTGYTRASGFNLATSVHRGGKRLVAVILGEDHAKTRDAHMVELIDRYLPRASAR